MTVLIASLFSNVCCIEIFYIRCLPAPFWYFNSLMVSAYFSFDFCMLSLNILTVSFPPSGLEMSSLDFAPKRSSNVC